jgi:hypothetical protein
MAKQTAKRLTKELDTPWERKFIDEPEEEKQSVDTHAKATIEITKGKLLKGDVVQIEYFKSDGAESKPAECSEKHTDPPRKELKDAFNSLAIHAALIGEFIPLTSVKDISHPDQEIIVDYNVSGFTIVASGDEDEGVILTAQKTLKNGKMLGFNTPTMRFNDASDNAYPYLDQLAKSVELCKHEMMEYLSGKHAVDPQLKLEL